jgi:hypothetical protein
MSCARAARTAARALLAVPFLVSPACGKKGPPLAPLIKVPAAASDFSGRRVGNDVHLRLTVPQTNTDGSRPASLEEITIYGFTGTPLANDDFLKRGTVVAKFPVKRPPPPLPPDAKVPPLPPPPGPGLEQGAQATAVEVLTDAVMQPIVPKPARRAPPPPEPSSTVIALPLAGPPAEMAAARIYVAVGTNGKGQRGPFSPRLSVALLPPPSPPTGPTVTYTERAVTVKWSPSPDARQAVQVPTVMPVPAPGAPGAVAPPTAPGTETQAPPPQPASTPAAPPPASAAAAPAAAAQPTAGAAAPAPAADPSAPLPSRPLSLASSASLYNVYEVNPGAQPEASASQLPTPLNPAPLAALTFQDARVEFGRERCYAVRTVNVFGTLGTESGSSEPVCVTPVDTFPPAAPASLQVVPSPGLISLIWNANTEPDLAGYVVLRGEASSDTLQPLMKEPISATNFNDTTVKAGVSYVYAVIASDKAGNPSAQSNRVTETAR